LRCISIAKQLGEDYDVFFVGSKNYNRFVEKEHFLIIENNSIAIDEVVQKAMSFDFSWINKGNLEKAFLNDLEIIERCKPDIIVGDANLSLRMVAEKMHVFYVAVENNYLSNRYSDIRPVPHTHKAWNFRDKMSDANWENLISFVEKIVLRSVHKPFRYLRKKYGLSQQRNLLDEFEGDVVLLLDNPDIFPLGALESNKFCIGPQLYRNEGSEAEIKTWIQERKHRKTIYVSMGSSADVEKNTYFMKHLSTSEFNVIFSGNGNCVTDTVFSKQFINFTEIAEYIDVYVCHGGNGSIYQALFHAIPLLMIPSIFEQEWNVHRIVKLNLGSVHYPEKGITDFLKKLNIQISRKDSTATSAMKNKLLEGKQYHDVSEIFEQIRRQLFPADYPQTGIGNNSVQDKKLISENITTEPLC